MTFKAILQALEGETKIYRCYTEF